MVPQSDLNETNKTTSFRMFVTKNKTEVCPTLWGIDDFSLPDKKIILFSRRENSGRHDGVSLFLCFLVFIVKLDDGNSNTFRI